MKRTNTCNELTSADKGKSVTLIGWVQSVRDHGGIIFVDLRDREGITQVVFHPECPVYRDAQKLKDESVIQIFGTVAMRENDTVNPSLKTGEIEVVADNMIIHNVCETLPFPLDNERADKVNEDLRLQYRYLDLRRPRNLNLLRMRHKAAKALREYLDSNGFTEVETPILFKSTPEGAREFLVPSRLNPGQFYALNQSPQQYKQMLMVSGIERYYQMAKCFRDEDLRADRQPEFTQVDIEMSFIDREDMYSLIENMLKKVWKDVLGIDIPTPFKRMPRRAGGGTGAGLLSRQGPVQPDGGHVHGGVQAVLLGLLDHPVPALQVGVGELELDGHLGGHIHVLLLLLGEDLKHDDVFLGHAAVVDQAVLAAQGVALVGEGCVLVCHCCLLTGGCYHS